MTDHEDSAALARLRRTNTGDPVAVIRALGEALDALDTALLEIDGRTSERATLLSIQADIAEYLSGPGFDEIDVLHTIATRFAGVPALVPALDTALGANAERPYEYRAIGINIYNARSYGNARPTVAEARASAGYVIEVTGIERRLADTPWETAPDDDDEKGDLR